MDDDAPHEDDAPDLRESPDLSELDLEDWDAVEAAIAELRELPPSDRARKFDEWRKSSFSGQFLTAVALGFQQVFGPPKREEVEIVAENPGEPEDEPFSLQLDRENPSESVMVVKPWLLRDQQD